MKKPRGYRVYGSYRFLAKDPVIDELRTALEDVIGERLNKKHMKRIEEQGGPRASTAASWFFGKTRRPQSATLEAAGRALGLRRVWIKMAKS